MKTDIGIIGGSGFYKFLKNPQKLNIKTPYGKTSDSIFTGDLFNKKVAFLPRHGSKHRLAPHKIPYQANIWALKKIGVSKIISISAAGSLQRKIKPGNFMICEDYIDFTRGARKDTFFENNDVRHISQTNPYCALLNEQIRKVLKFYKLPFHNNGTAVIINGPRFSTPAESKICQNWGGSIINMTQYPEIVLANELGICYANISLVTDYDAWVEKRNIKLRSSNTKEMMKTFAQNIEKLKIVLFKIIKDLNPKPCKICRKKAENAKI